MTDPVALRVVEASRDDAPVLDKLLELYAYDFSEMLGLDISVGGSYFPGGWPWVSNYERVWLLHANDRPVGFAIATLGSVIDGRADVWDMHEFFVVRRHRRTGAGLHLARTVWRRQPGTWDLRIIQSNGPALAFWRHAVQEAGHALEPRLAINTRTGKSEHVFRFEPNFAGTA